VTGAGPTLRRQAGQLAAVPRAGMIRAAKLTKKLAADEAARAVPGGVMHLHRKGKPPRRVKLRARDDIRPAGRQLIRCRVQALPVGPWVWIDTGTGPHVIGRNAKGRRRYKTVGPQRPGTGARLHLGTDWITGPVHHPGSRGHGAWRRVVAATHEQVPALFDDEVVKALRHG
jgi:hypothetical protein